MNRSGKHRTMDNGPSNPSPAAPVAKVTGPPIQLAGRARCPRCNRPTDTPGGSTLRAWYCHHCQMEFEPEEDGDVGYSRPETIAARREEYKARRARRTRRT